MTHDVDINKLIDVGENDFPRKIIKRIVFKHIARYVERSYFKIVQVSRFLLMICNNNYSRQEN